jgi:spore photoproduct lyase
MEKTLVSWFEKIWIHEDSRDSDLAHRILNLFPYEKIQFVTADPVAAKGPLSSEQFSQSKKWLYIKPFVGQFFKRCPGATQKKTLTCCNYYVLNLGQQCNMNCSYCYLQSYLNSPTMLMFSNIDQAIGELRSMATEHPNLPFRVGTGEVIDSLSLDPITLYSRKLIEFFREFPTWKLELKTKSECVDQFLDCEHAGNIIIGWSLNCPQVIESEEHGTARLQERLTAARKCLDRGFLVSFHIDPLIWFPDWKDGYGHLVSEITRQFTAEEILVTSVGALRFQPEQRHMMRERFGLKSKVVSAEMFPSEGNKLRYDLNLRREMYDFVLGQFHQRSKNWKIFLCMETPETWISSFDQTPMQVPALKEFFRPLPKIQNPQDTPTN